MHQDISGHLTPLFLPGDGQWRSGQACTGKSGREPELEMLVQPATASDAGGESRGDRS